MDRSTRTQVWMVFLLPVMLSIGIVLLPVAPDYSDHSLAALAANQNVRWFVGHIIAAIAFAVSVQSVLVVFNFIRTPSGKITSFVPVLVAAGAGVYSAGLGADGIGPLALLSVEMDPRAFFDGSG